MAATSKPRRDRKPIQVIDIRPAGPGDQVVTLEGGSFSYRRKPCGGCPWVVENAGTFPAEAFRHSASTAFDMSTRCFACHESGVKSPATCAGFLLRGADHNLRVRLGRMKGEIAEDVTDGGRLLFDGYKEMAIANGVPEDDAAIADCR
ncbi:DUF6283 family protein [Hydrogenophaga sp. 2FB]|uniref:DUF6283 family protein n=1 Tax=Hydrogenophaga sp. 2FB TaxID=2502187 RepID=UPI0010FA4AEC|nr:DUF6283 family protein [Hydrogenophaga sp. 2FB]